MAFGSFVLQRDLNFTVNRGDIFIIMGGSGCGKSTLLRHLIGLQTPAKGQILYGDVDFWGLEPEERDTFMRRFGILYQSGALWSSMTLAQNVALPLEDEAAERHRQFLRDDARSLCSAHVPAVPLLIFRSPARCRSR